MTVSFIIPAYNAADTIERCLNSIMTQSWDDMSYEIIIVDDASTDDTVRIIEEYLERLRIGDLKYNVGNLTLFLQPENNRQGAARNRGVKIAKGEYICFVDSDDAITEGVVDAIRLAKDKQTDMIAYHYAFVNEEGMITKEAERMSFAAGQLFSGIEMQNKHPYWCSGPVAYIYNRAFLERVNYPFVEGVLYEDSDFVANHLYYAKRMAYSSKIGYMAYYREGSTTHSTSYKNVADYLLLGTRMMALYERIMYDVSCMMSAVPKEEVEKFAEEILEGACFNIERSCRRILKLNSAAEVRAYYERVDKYANRQVIVTSQRYRTYYWNAWTGLCLKHKILVVALLTCVIPLYRGVKYKCNEESVQDKKI